MASQGRQDFSDAPVQLDNRIASQSRARSRPRNRGCGTTGDVGVVGGEIEEERPPRVSSMNVYGFLGDGVGHLLVFPAGCLAAAHPTDAADAVDDRIVVAVARLLIRQQLGVVPKPVGIVPDFLPDNQTRIGSCGS